MKDDSPHNPDESAKRRKITPRSPTPEEAEQLMNEGHVMHLNWAWPPPTATVALDQTNEDA